MFTRPQIATVVAEFMGTAILVMVALVLSQTTAVSYFIGTSVAATLAVVYVIFGSISGAHVNPAITFGMWTARKIGTLRAVAYIAAQLLGGLAALQLYQYFTNHTLPAKNQVFSTPMWLAEVVGAGVLAMALTAAISKKFDTLTTALAYGVSFFVGIMIAATASAAYLNPAIALGVRNWNAVYVLGPLVGGLIGVNLYTMLFAGETIGRRKK
ncbi:MAG TPA: aquaporin [Candidatus Saccharimonadales bacterium]|nr:aquaporin [Candidatus Saccharimonadales bacterium]